MQILISVDESKLSERELEEILGKYNSSVIANENEIAYAFTKDDIHYHLTAMFDAGMLNKEEKDFLRNYLDEDVDRYLKVIDEIFDKVHEQIIDWDIIERETHNSLAKAMAKNLDVVSKDTVINGSPIGFVKDSTTHNVFENTPYIFNDQKYLLLVEDPVPDQGYYSAPAVRVGDPINDGEAPVHELRWNILSPYEYGLTINKNTIIEGTKWGTLTVGQLMDKIEDSPFFVNGVGSLVPIETDHVKDNTASVRCVQLDDVFHGDAGNEIHIYELSWNVVKDKDIKSYMDLPQFTVEFKGETRKYVNTDEIHQDYICDWDHPSDVKENIDVVQAKNKKVKIAEAAR